MMMIKKLMLKFRQGIILIRKDGLLAFTIRLLQILQSRSARSVSGRKQDLIMPVKYADAIAADLSKASPEWSGRNKKQLTFNWIMPPPGKGSGGHMTIFRFIKYLEEAGHICRIYLYGVHGNSPIGDIKKVMGESFPDVQAVMKWIDHPNDIEPADGIIATSWETAYPIYNSSVDAKRFYFVQDFEPFFYPVGSLSILAENTYRFGFYGITAGNWLATKLNSDYGMNTDYFNFGADKSVYSYNNTSTRKEILYYCRPFTDRRGFEIAIMALDLFHRKNPDYIINLFGWDISSFKIPFPYNNLKTLEHHELNDLYNRCAAGLVMSLTNMSLLPLELLCCGAIPVVNKGENNTLVSNNPYIAYSEPNPLALANTLSLAVKNANPKYSKEASLSVKNDNWDTSGKKIVKIFEEITRNKASE